MNIRTLMIGATFATVLNCAAAHAQVLGGDIGGAVGGTLSGGMRDMGVITHGNAAGSLGTDLDTGSLHRSTRDTLDRTTTRARNTAGAARNRAESTISSARDSSANIATSAAATATQSVNPQQIDAVTNVAGSVAGDASTNGAQLAGAANGAADQQAVLGSDALKSGLPNVTDNGQAVPQGTTNAGESSGALGGVTGSALSASNSPSTASAPSASEAPSASNVLSTSGNANGAASGDASASKRGVPARTSASASAQGSGSANVGTGEE